MLDLLDHLGISLGEATQLMALACKEVESEPYIEIKTRVLDDEECGDLHAWLVALPGTTWSDDDRDHALEHLRETHQALVTIPAHMTSEATYCKAKWG
jgi:hypothetical protein